MRDFFKQYIPYYKNYIKKFIYAFIGIVLVAAGTSGTAYIMKPLLDDIFINKDEQMLMILPIMVIALYSAKGFGRYIQAYYISYIGQDIIRKVRDNLFSHVLHLDLAFFNSKHSGELISRITNDINRIQLAISNQIASFVQEILTIIALIAMVIYQSAELAFYGLIVMPIAIYPLTVLAKKMKKLSYRSQEKNSDITSHLSESFNNIEIIKASSAINLETLRFKEHNKEFFKINIKSVKTNELVSPIMEILGAIAVAIVIVIGGQYVIDGKLTAGEFFSFLTALFMLYTPIKRISSLYNKMQDALAANERINELFKLEPKILSGDKSLQQNINQISFNDIGLKFKDKDALKNINLTAKKGETIALVGDSGGGKSSLINILVRFYDSTSGNILIDNQDIKDISLNNLRDNISIVTQRVYIFNDTVGENISYGQEYNKEKAINALKQAYAFDFVSKLEFGIDTVLDEFGTNLSGGQRQRIAIARALYKNPQILIFDEATSALDNESEAIITKVLQEVNDNKIIFVIAHRLTTIKNAHKIALFKNGNILCQGTQKQLLENCKDYQKLENTNR